MKADIYTRVTETILSALEQGTRPWMQPWNAEHAAGAISRPLRHNGKPYSGINVLMLWATAMEKGYSAPIWMTFKQAHELGAHVRKGERGALVVYANAITRTETDAETGEEEEHRIPYMKGYTVFNVEQIDGLPAHYTAKAQPVLLSEAERNARLEAFFAATHADIRHGGNKAFYVIDPDYIQMPDFESFRDAESYYATLAHEATHWTRHPKRLDRDMGRKKWGDAGYAMEELVAEIGSAFLCAELGLTPEIREDHAAYIQNWLKVLKDDQKAIFTAASQAQKAADYLLSLQPEPEPEPEPEDAPAGEPQSQPSPAGETEPPPARGGRSARRGRDPAARNACCGRLAPGQAEPACVFLIMPREDEPMNTDWTIEAGAEGGLVVHHTAPRFRAQWTSGQDDLADIEGLCWTSEGSEEDDTLHVFGFAWSDPPPDQATFEALMRQATTAIDAWITAGL